MAVYRPPQKCISCGEVLKPVYRDQSKIPVMQRLIGDTFVGYAPHKCDPLKVIKLKFTPEMKKLIKAFNESLGKKKQSQKG